MSEASTLEAPPTSNGSPKRRTRKPVAPRAPRKVTPRDYAVEKSVEMPIANDSSDAGAPVMRDFWDYVVTVIDKAAGEKWIAANGEDGTRYRIVCILREGKVDTETIVKRKFT